MCAPRTLWGSALDPASPIAWALPAVMVTSSQLLPSPSGPTAIQGPIPTGGGGFLSAKRSSQHENVYGFAQQKLKVWTDRLQGTDVRPRVLLGLRWVCRIG